MLEYFTPEDNDLEDTYHHKHIRELTYKQPNTPDDREIKEKKSEVWLKEWRIKRPQENTE